MRRADDGLRALFRSHLREDMFWTTIETGMTSRGVPDSNYLSINGVEGWIEYKACDAVAVQVRPEQIGWHMRRARYGGRSWFGIRKRHSGGKLKGLACDELYLVQGRFAQVLSEQGLDCGHALFMGGDGSEHWNWSKVRKLICAP